MPTIPNMAPPPPPPPSSLLIGPPLIHRHRPSPVDDDGGHRSDEQLSPQNPCVNLFLSQQIDRENLTDLLEASANHDPLTTLKLILLFRRSSVATFAAAILWLHYHHPLTLACNVKVIAGFGSLKDVVLILHRVTNSESTTEWKKKSGMTENRQMITSDQVIEEDRMAGAKRAVQKFNDDANYRFLHNRVSDLFVELLQSDLKFFRSGEIGKISMAAKYCPSLDSCYDKSTLICESIAKKLFPKETLKEYRGINDFHYVYRVRIRLQKEVLVPLRNALRKLESNQCSKEKANIWVLKKAERNLISVFQNNYHRLFTKDNDERFRVLLEMVDGCKSRICRMTHHFVASISGGLNEKSAELQWRKLVDYFDGKGKWRNCVVVCNVSKWMKGTSMEYLSIGIGLLLSELSQEPWRRTIFAHGPDPKLYKIEGNSFQTKINFIKGLEFGGKLTFGKVFDEILRVGVEKKLSKEAMVKKIVVITDESFEEATNLWSPWACLFNYKRKGYEELPEIMFWNIKEAVAMPVKCDHRGLTKIRGFSTGLLAMLLENEEVPVAEDLVRLSAGLIPKTPEDIMQVAISGKEFQDLIALD